MSGVSERANGRASGPVLTFLFLFVPDHSPEAVHYEEESREAELAEPVAEEEFAPAEADLEAPQYEQPWQAPHGE